MNNHEHTIAPWILIPAYDPTESLLPLVRKLIEQQYTVLVVNDGSSEDKKQIFLTLAGLNGVKVLTHSVNRGKGQALKTGINYFLLHSSQDNAGLVTADADGQHLPVDIIDVAQQGAKSGDVILGVRSFPSGTPLRSRLGNIITRYVFRFFVNSSISDTQTGMRFIPRDLLPEILRLPYDRYEYELAMLIALARTNRRIVEYEISTVYLDGNSSSHFNPLLDSIAIYCVFLRFSGLSIATAIIDYLVFALVFFTQHSLLFSIIIARLLAGSFNFLIARQWVFQSQRTIIIQLSKYIALVCALMFFSWTFTKAIYTTFGGYVLIAKLFSEGLLFFASFSIQRMFIFNKDKTKDSI